MVQQRIVVVRHLRRCQGARAEPIAPMRPPPGPRSLVGTWHPQWLLLAAGRRALRPSDGFIKVVASMPSARKAGDCRISGHPLRGIRRLRSGRPGAPLTSSHRDRRCRLGVMR
jgi:hypothetical protein